MRTIPAPLKARVTAGSSSLARIWTVTRTDGVTRRFTDLDCDITVGSELYTATTSFTISDVSVSKSRGAQAADMRVLLDDDLSSIDWDDVLQGLYDKAHIKVEVVDFIDPSLGTFVLFDGFVGAITSSDKNWGNIELKGRLQASLQTIGELYSPECRADLFDIRCGLDKTLFKTTGTVFSVASNRNIEVQLATNPDNHHYSFGVITWLTGANTGVSTEVLTQFANTATEDELLFGLSTAKDILIGDTFEIYAGCDKNPDTCRTKFSNILNYRGEPFVPGPDIIKDAPTTNPPSDPSGGLL